MGGTVTMTIFSIQHDRQGLAEVERISDDDGVVFFVRSQWVSPSSGRVAGDWPAGAAAAVFR